MMDLVVSAAAMVAARREARRRQGGEMRLPDGYELVRNPLEFGITELMGPDGLVAKIDDASLHSHPDIESDVQRMAYEDMRRREMERSMYSAAAQAGALNGASVLESMLGQQQTEAERRMRDALQSGAIEPSIMDNIRRHVMEQQPLPPDKVHKGPRCSVTDPGGVAFVPDIDKLGPLEYLRIRHRRWTEGVEIN